MPRKNRGGAKLVQIVFVYSQNRCSLRHVVRINDATANRETTHLHWVATHDQYREAKLLLEFGANVDSVGHGHATPLHFASKNNSSKVAKLLLEAGASVNSAAKSGATPLHWAAQHKSFKLVEMLLDAGANVNARTRNGATPLHLAAGPNQNTYPFHNANKSLRERAVRTLDMLVQNGADVNATDHNGRTPLHCVVRKKHALAPVVAYLLLAVGADATTVDAKGKDALYYAAMIGPPCNSQDGHKGKTYHLRLCTSKSIVRIFLKHDPGLSERLCQCHPYYKNVGPPHTHENQECLIL